MPEDSAPTIWTIGHSTHKIETFLEMLQSQAIKCLGDVRRFPGSRRHPQFGQEKLIESLATVNIQYVHLPALGGRRSGRLPDSPNGAWRVEAFNCYADYMLTPEFKAAIEDLDKLAGQKRTAIMCAEALPSRCHRRLISDFLLVHDWTVQHILSVRRVEEHRLPEFASVREQTVTYPASTLF
jgi:uncharacterized protein (DUF488 family)